MGGAAAAEGQTLTARSRAGGCDCGADRAPLNVLPEWSRQMDVGRVDKNALLMIIIVRFEGRWVPQGGDGEHFLRHLVDVLR